MVELIHNDSDGPGARELKRMYVESSCRGMGIGEKLLIEVIARVKRQKLKKIVLTTATIQLVHEFGFKQMIGSPGQAVHIPGGIKESYWSIYTSCGIKEFSQSLHIPGIKGTGQSIYIPIGKVMVHKVADMICLELYISSDACRVKL